MTCLSYHVLLESFRAISCDLIFVSRRSRLPPAFPRADKTQLRPVVGLISMPGKKPASSTVFLSELLYLVYFLFFLLNHTSAFFSMLLTPSKIGDQSSTVTLISPGKKPASSTVFLSELLNLVYFLFFF